MQPAAARGKHCPSVPACGSIQLSQVPANRLQGIGKRLPCSQAPPVKHPAARHHSDSLVTAACCNGNNNSNMLVSPVTAAVLAAVHPPTLHRTPCAEPAACGISALQDPSDGMSALMKAADGGHAEALVTLLQAGCPWNLQDHEGYTAGATPLINLVSCRVELGAQRYAFCSP